MAHDTDAWMYNSSSYNEGFAGYITDEDFQVRSAFFPGLFDGRVTEIPDADGVWQLSVFHEELPDPQQSAAITGGDWRLRVGWQTQFQGEVGEGSLYNNGDETFAVKAELTRAGEEAVWFFGLLDHTGVPPSLRGCILQAEPSDPPTTDSCD